MTDKIEIDGAMGEGGGQVLRTALSLAMVTGRAFQLQNIRAGRAKPGLGRQHLTAVNAAAHISQARVTGNELGSTKLDFAPRAIKAGEFTFNIGTAGSTILVLQTVLPALLQAERSSRVVIKGGTHNPAAPSFDFLSQTFLPLLRRMGANVEARLVRLGFVPAGGGCIEVDIDAPAQLIPIALNERGKIIRRHATIWLAGLKGKIATREKRILQHALGLADDEFTIECIEDSSGPGNVISVVYEAEHVTEVFTSHGRRGILAEGVAEEAADAAMAWLKVGAPVGPQLADQLLLPMALAGGGSFYTGSLTAHARTNMAVIQKFVAAEFVIEKQSESVCRVDYRASPEK